MSVIKKFDRIGYYYTFEYYLYEQELDYTVLDYAQNNGIELGSLVCFFDMIKDDVHYIVTTDEKGSHKVISISKFSSVDNLILNNIIYYNGYKFTISDNMSLLDIENLIKIPYNDEIIQTHIHKHNPLARGTIQWWQNYALRFDTIMIFNLRILSVITNCKYVKYIHTEESQGIESNILKLNMIKLFPNLKMVCCYDGKIIYHRETK
jgi:hypothetical protein